MLYFKNTELAETYHVSLRTVLNWVEASKEGKLDLELYKYNDRDYVANTTKNISKIESIVEERKKYRNTRGFKVISPKPDFYELFDKQQIFDIISYLEGYHEIERQYNYFDGGADAWDTYAKKLVAEEGPNTIKSTIKLLNVNQSYIEGLLSKYKRVNIIDVGVGNALPVKEFLGQLLDRGKLGRYIAIDISPRMLKIARDNINQWYNGRVNFEGHILDINYDRFTNFLANEYLKEDSKETANLVLLLGGTDSNLRAPDGAFKTIHDSMNASDFLIYTNKLDTPRSRKYFDFSVEPKNSVPPPTHRMMVDLLNIDESLYTLELGYNEQLCSRYEQLRLNTALSIKFDFADGTRLVDFHKGDAILIWRAWQQSAYNVIDQFEKNGFYPIHISQTVDHEYILIVAATAPTW
jgi:uncharacterized SAM-dependent methyltransferase